MGKLASLTDNLVIAGSETHIVPVVQEGLILHDDFSSGLRQFSDIGNGFQWRGQRFVTSSTDQVLPGHNKSLRFQFLANDDPNNPETNHAFSELRSFLGSFYKELWIQYALWFPDHYINDFANDKGNFQIWNTLTGNPADGDNGSGYGLDREGPHIATQWWARDDEPWSPSNNTHSSCSVNGVQSHNRIWNDGPTWDGAFTEGVHTRMVLDGERGHWHGVKIHLKYATKANFEQAVLDGHFNPGDGYDNGYLPYGDGVFELWHHDHRGEIVKQMNIINGDWYGTKLDSLEEARGWDYGYLLGWANGGFEQETHIHMGDFAISTTEAGLPPMPSLD